MSELTLTEASMKAVDFAFDSLFGTKPAQPREPDELAHAIAAATERDLHDVDMWLTALREDVAYNDPQMKQLLLLAMNGEDMQFGVRLAQAIRRQVIHNATEETRDEFAAARDQAGAA